MKKNKSAKIIFGDALGNGMKTAMINGITVSMTGGVIGGIQGMRNGARMARIFKGVQKEVGNSFRTQEAQKLLATDKQGYLDKFNDAYCNEVVVKDKTLMAYGGEGKSVPDAFGNVEEKYGFTFNYKVNGKYYVEIYDPAFSSDFQLWTTMNHEYLHVSYKYFGLPHQFRLGEAGCRTWENEVYQNAGKDVQYSYGKVRNRNLKRYGYTKYDRFGISTTCPFPYGD